MVDVVLVNPPLSARARYGGLAGVGNQLPNLGLAYLAGFLRQEDIDVTIIDAAALGLSTEDTAHAIAAAKPAICGFTATTLAIGSAAAVAAKLKLLNPECVTLIGGAHVSSRPAETLVDHWALDYAVIGEGEVTAWELFDEIQAHGDVAAVPGIAYRDEAALVRTEPRPLIDNLDDLPLPAWDLLPDLATTYMPSPQSVYRLPSTILFTARGCPYGCTFCDRSVFGRKLRQHSAARVWEMMEHLYRQFSIIDFAFHDESLLIDEGRLVELCRHIQRSHLPLSFSCQGRVDQKVSPFAMREMVKAGCWQVSYGIESGSDEILRILGKGTLVEEAYAALKTTRAAGIATKAFIMLGNPGETRQSLRATAQFLRKAELEDVMVGFFTPFPGTALAVNIEQYGQVVGSYGQMSEHEVTFVPNGLTARQLTKSRRKLYRRFYLRPRVIRHYLRRLREPSGRKVLLRAARSFLRNFLLRR